MMLVVQAADWLAGLHRHTIKKIADLRQVIAVIRESFRDWWTISIAVEEWGGRENCGESPGQCRVCSRFVKLELVLYSYWLVADMMVLCLPL